MNVMRGGFTLFVLMIILGLSICAGQEIIISVSGPTTANVNDTKFYYAEFRNEQGELVTPLENGWWSVSGGTVTSSTDVSANVLWTYPGYGQVHYTYEDPVNVFFASLAVEVAPSAPQTPSTTFSFDRYCGSTKVIRNSGPTSTGVEWYWQTSSTGTSTTLGAQDNITVSSGLLYLRARSGTVWSTSSLQVTGLTFITSPPPAPASATHGHVIKNSSVAIPLSASAVSGATSYKWYNNSGSLITTTASPSYTPTVSATTTFQVASVISFCESTGKTSVTANVYPEPVVSVTNGGRISNGNVVTLSISNFTYDEYQWFKVGETSFTTGASFQAAGEGSYKVRVKKGTSPYFEIASGIQVWEGLNGQNVNYIVSNTIQVPGVTDPALVKNLDWEENLQTVQYFDGLGRPMQTVATQNTPLKKDLVQPIVYDAFGRETHRYLPYASGNTGLYKTNFLEQHQSGYATSDQNVFYNGSGMIADGEGKAFAETRFENSPLNRVLEQGAPGTPWQPDQIDSYESSDRTVKFSYEINSADEVLLWSYTYPNETHPAGKVTAYIGAALTYYEPRQLYKKRTKDEQYHEVIEYTDKEGKLVLKRVQAPDNVWADTYYIYDNLGNLVIVLPPEAVKALTEN